MAEKKLSADELAQIERTFDPESAFRPTGKSMGFLITAGLVAMSIYHFYASGFALIQELTHRGIHLSFVLGLVFLLFSWRKSLSVEIAPKEWYRFDGVPFSDILLASLGVFAAMYLPLLPSAALAMRVGNPSAGDVFMGDRKSVV